MSQTTGGELKRQAAFVLLDNGMVQLPGGLGAIDMSTEEGVAEAGARLAAEEKAELHAMLAARGFVLHDGVYVPSDAIGGIPKGADAGPLAVRSGQDELDHLLEEEVFRPAGVPCPYNANTTPALHARLQGTPAFQQAVEGTKTHVNNPTRGNFGGFLQYMDRVAQQNPDGNYMEVLYAVFKSSVREINEDKKYFLKKLMMYNKMGAKLADYLKELVDVQKAIDDQKKSAMDAEDKDNISAPATRKELDMTSLDAEGNAIMVTVGREDEHVKQFTLTNMIKEVEADQEKLRNARQMAQTSFQNFDQKSNQMFNLLAQVVKYMNEMRHAPIKNML